MKTIQELAADYLKQFEHKKRINGASFYSLKDSAPKELKELVQAAHEGMSPDDYKYEYALDALYMLSESENDGMENRINEIEADSYTSDLLAWVSSNLERLGYVDEQARELGHSAIGAAGDLMQGQVYERVKIANSVFDSMREIMDEMGA